MWKKLLFLLSMMLMTSLTNTAEISCLWSGEVCNQPSITPVTQLNEAITVAGKPANYINTGTSSLNFYKMKPSLNYIPTKLFSVFTFLNYFGMSSSSPKLTLVTNAFVNCNYLNIIGILDANIVNVPEGFAQACTNIKAIQLTSAGIETLHKNAFKGLVNLVELQMSNNKISCLPPELFQTMPNIQSLFVDRNKIKALDRTLFRNLPKLSFIYFRDNLISYLPLFDFTGTAQMGKLTLFVPGNPIFAFNPDFCSMFDSRPANFEYHIDVPHVKCFLTNNAQTQDISRLNCRTTMASNLQNCYLNWTTSMNAPVTCGSSWSSIWQQILDYLKTRVKNC